MAYPAKVTPEIIKLVEQAIVIEGISVAEVAKRLQVSTVTVHSIRKSGYNMDNYRNRHLKTAAAPLTVPQRVYLFFCNLMGSYAK